MSEHEPIPPSLARLFEAEPAAPPAGAQERVHRRLAASIVVGAPFAAPAVPHGARTFIARHAFSLLAGAFVAGAAVGAVATVALRHAPPPHVVSVERPAPPSPPIEPSSAPPSSNEPVAPPVASSHPAPSAPPDRSHAVESSAERALVEAARRHLAEGDPVAALAAIDEHARRFPRGRLVEEREALAVQTLVLLARYGDARARATAFHARWPGSIYAAAVDASVSSIP